MKSFLRVACLVLGVGGLAAGARAEDPQQPFQALIGEGFQIVGTFYMPPTEKTAAAAVVTLQRGSAVAVCTFAAGAWETMTPDVLQQASACDVRFM